MEHNIEIPLYELPHIMVVRILRFEIRILRYDAKLKEKNLNHTVYLKVP